MRLLSRRPAGDPRFLLLTGAVMREPAKRLLGLRPCGFRPQHSHKLGGCHACLWSRKGLKGTRLETWGGFGAVDGVHDSLSWLLDMHPSLLLLLLLKLQTGVLRSWCCGPQATSFCCTQARSRRRGCRAGTSIWTLASERR